MDDAVYRKWLEIIDALSSAQRADGRNYGPIGLFRFDTVLHIVKGLKILPDEA